MAKKKSEITEKERAFKADVLDEMNLLKYYAWPEEITKLDEKSFNPQDVRDCIYGQMTGSCFSKRAKALIKKACKVAVSFEQAETEDDDGNFKYELAADVLPHVVPDGQRQDQMLYSKDIRTFKYLSALESYVMTNGARWKEVIAYLKGETSEITL